MTKLKTLGTVMVGDTFVCPGGSLAGSILEVVGFMPASYVNRVVLRSNAGQNILMPLEMVEIALFTRPVRPTLQ